MPSFVARWLDCASREMLIALAEVEITANDFGIVCLEPAASAVTGATAADFLVIPLVTASATADSAVVVQVVLGGPSGALVLVLILSALVSGILVP